MAINIEPFRLTTDVAGGGPWHDLRAGGCHHGLFLNRANGTPKIRQTVPVFELMRPWHRAGLPAERESNDR